MHWLAVDPPHAPPRRPPALTDAVLEKKNANSIRQEFAHNIGSVSRSVRAQFGDGQLRNQQPGPGGGKFPGGLPGNGLGR